MVLWWSTQKEVDVHSGSPKLLLLAVYTTKNVSILYYFRSIDRAANSLDFCHHRDLQYAIYPV